MFSGIRVPLISSLYRIDRTLHKDKYETIYVAIPLEGTFIDTPLVLKHIPLKSLPISIDRNVLHLNGIFHENIITTYECFYEQGDLWVVMPYFESVSLEKLLQDHYLNGITDKDFVSYILRAVLLALDRIHTSSAVIKGLKPSKILINTEGCVKILDCEISAVIRTELLRKKIANPYWTAPEVISGAYHDTRSDVWSFGILVLTMVRGKNPWEDYPNIKAGIMIVEKMCPKISKEAECDHFLRDVVNFCLQKDPQKRPTTTILLENSYFRRVDKKGYVSILIKRLLNCKETKVRKVESMPQPKPLSGEDPNEMLELEVDP